MTPDDVPGLQQLQDFGQLVVYGPLGIFCLFLIACVVILFAAWRKSQDARITDNKDNQKDTLTGLNNSTVTTAALTDAVKQLSGQIAGLREDVADLKGRSARRS